LHSQPFLDPNYHEDSQADVDLNVMMTANGRTVEIQIIAEYKPFDRALLDQMLSIADATINKIIAIQKESL